MLLAAHSGDADRIKTLLEQGKRPDLMDNHGWTALHHSAAKGHLQCVECLLTYSLPEYNITHIQTYEGETALFLACKHNNGNGFVEIVERLIKTDPSSVNISNNESVTPLHIACFKQNSAVVELLVNAHADIDALDFNDFTPLNAAAEGGSLDCVEILLYAGADASMWNLCDLYLALMHTPCIKMILEFMHIDHIVTVGPDNPTLLMCAAQVHNKDIVELLLSKGADPHIQRFGGMLAVDFAHKDYECVEILLKAMNQNCIHFLEERVDVYSKTPMGVAKLTCEVFPALFAPFAIHYIFHQWEKSREDCVHILQLILSQLEFGSLFQNESIRIQIDTPKLFSIFLDLIDHLILYGHDVVLGLGENSMNWRPYFFYMSGPSNVWFIRALSYVNPWYSPHFLLKHWGKSVHEFESEIPPSWEMEFSGDGKMMQKVYSLKHLSRCSLRNALCERGVFYYKEFQQAIKQSKLPLSLQIYLQYLEGCA